MPEFTRFFISLLFASLFMTSAATAQSYQQQQDYGNQPSPNMAYTPETQADELSPHQSYGDKVGLKTINAFANLTTGWLEIPKNIINTTNQSNFFYGVFGGLLKGIVNTAGRMGVGIADLITAPIPTKPITRPVRVWDNFDVDTTYGDVFRLDKS
ncbi:MAG: exosortase system-associated protein, TIGR04073 family [Methylobacter sp.]|nr:exosortase system-associated protein, TIGR04073 family [Methylobacter sp.]